MSDEPKLPPEFFRRVNQQAADRPLPIPMGIVPPQFKNIDRMGLQEMADAMHSLAQHHMGMLLTEASVQSLYDSIREMIGRRQKEFRLDNCSIYITGGWNLDRSDYVFIVAIDETGPVVRMHLRPSMSLAQVGVSER